MDYRLLHGDCLDLLPTLAAGSVDLVLADPPYGTTACRWDSVIDLARLWPLLRRVAKPNAAIVLFAAQPFTSALVMSNPREFRYSWVWEKSSSTGFLDAQRRPLRAHEDVCVFYRRQPTYNPQKVKGEPIHATGKSKGRNTLSVYRGAHDRLPSDLSGWRYPRTVLQFGKHSSTETLHPTQKPTDLCSYLVRTYSNPGDVVLDFCMGSGTTGVACVQEGRDFIGIEKDTEHGYFAIAEKRIAGAQPPLVLAGD